MKDEILSGEWNLCRLTILDANQDQEEDGKLPYLRVMYVQFCCLFV
jgi:hypothetical protein